jgi:hypothetical protein
MRSLKLICAAWTASVLVHAQSEGDYPDYQEYASDYGAQDSLYADYAARQEDGYVFVSFVVR